MSYSRQTLHRLAITLLVLGLCGSAVADEPTGPLAAMREAAEAQADVDPATPAVRDALRLQKSTPKAAQGVSPAASQDTLRAALRAAAREEMARDLGALQSAGQGSAISAAHRAEAAGGSGDKEAREQARSAAVQAQSAKAVGLQRVIELGRGVGSGNSNGNSNGRSALSLGAGHSK